MRFTRFVLVGGLCALLSNVAVVLLVRSGFGILAASVIAFGPVLLAGYGLHSFFTFGTQPTQLTFLRYTFATAANFPLSVCVLYVGCDLLRLPVELVAPGTTALLFLWNYISSKWAFMSSGASNPVKPAAQ